MSRQTLIPLLKWRQGAGQRSISQTTWAINLMAPNCTRFASVKPILGINLLGAGSIAIFWALGMSSIKPAQANLLKQQAMLLEQSQAAGATDANAQPVSGTDAVPQPISTVEPFHENTSTSQDSQSLAIAVEPVANPAAQVQALRQPAADLVQEDAAIQPRSGVAATSFEPQTPLPPVVVQTNPTPIAETRSLTPASTIPSVGSSTGRVTSNPGKLAAPPVLVAIGGNSDRALGQLTPASQRSCSSSTSCSDTVSSSITPVLPPNSSNTKLAQLPYPPQTSTPLPVPAAPIPLGSNSSNPTLGQLPSLPQPPSPLQQTVLPVGYNNYNPTGGQLPYLPQAPNPVQQTLLPVGFNSYNPTGGQLPYYPQTIILMPVTASPQGGFIGYNAAGGQSPYYPQTVILMPVTASPPGGFNSYNPTGGPSPYYPQTPALVPVTASPPGGFNSYNPSGGQSPYYPQPGFNSYNPTGGQSAYYPQNVPPLPAPLTPAPVGFNSYNLTGGQSAYYPQAGFNSYNPTGGQSAYYPQNAPPLPAPLTPPQGGFNSYNPTGGQYPYYPQNTPPVSVPPAPNLVPANNYNPTLGQSPYYPQNTPPVPVPPAPNPVLPNNYNPGVGQSPYFPQTPPVQPYAPNPNLAPPAQPYAPNPNLTPPAPPPTTGLGAAPPTQPPSLTRRTAVTEPSLQLQGTYILQGDDSSARVRLSGLYPLNSRTLFGGTLDLTSEANSFSDSPGQGLNINELYVATAPFADLPNFRFVVGQLDLTSYFDRNSFAKDAATHFFNPVFQTNPALSATGVSSRPGALVNWTITDNIEAKAAIFSSARTVNDFTLDGFAGEIGLRYGNGIIRGTFVSDRDAGSRDGFQEIFGVARSDGGTGLRTSDREEAYGVNGEYFFPQLNMGVFGRYGRYDNRELGLGGDTFSGGISFVDVFSPNDRLGLAYGRTLSNDKLRRERGDEVPDVLELFYDFRFLPNLRLGFTFQQRNDFSETYGGFRVKTEFDVTPRGRLAP